MAVGNQEIDIFNMSDEDFMKYEAGEYESPEPSSEEIEPDEDDSIGSEDNLDTEAVESSDEEDDESQEEDTQYEDEDESDEDTEETETETSEEEQTSIRYEDEYKKLIGSPIKANGKEITIDSMDDAIRLVQMGMNYSKNMQQLKPAQRIITMLEDHKLLDESKLSFAIDLLNKKPEAINKLVEDLDLSEIMDYDPETYQQSNYAPTEQRIALDTALKQIEGSPTFDRTVDVLGTKWDATSRQTVQDNPQVIGFINEHMENGVFDTVMKEVDRQRMLGILPQGLNDIQTYQHVGNTLYANNPQQAVPSNGQQSAVGQATVAPIRKPSKETVIRQKKAASNTGRGTRRVSKQMEDVFAMSDEEFLKKYK